MDSKAIFLVCIIAFFNFAQSAIVAPVLTNVEDVKTIPQYTFAYDVQDALTGDSKAQFETRTGDVVRGSYSLIEPDGTRRTVEYTSDPFHGFRTIITREPTVAIAAQVPAIAKVTPLVGQTVVNKAVAAPVLARTLTGAPVGVTRLSRPAVHVF